MDKTVSLLYTGPDVNLGRFGAVKKGDVIIATPEEAANVQDDERFIANPADADIKKVKAEVAKAKADEAAAQKAIADAQAKVDAAQAAAGKA